MGTKVEREVESKKNTVWNSLELTKIVVGSATPLAIAILGIIFSVSAANQARLSREAEADQAKLTRALDRRLEVWNGVGPKIRQVRDQTANIYRNSAPRLPADQRRETIGAEALEALMQDVEGTLEVRPFFTPAVMQRYLDFTDCTKEVLQAITFNARGGELRVASPRLRSIWDQAAQRYRLLIDRVREELATEPPAGTGRPSPVRISLRGPMEASVCLGEG